MKHADERKQDFQYRYWTLANINNSEERIIDCDEVKWLEAPADDSKLELSKQCLQANSIEPSSEDERMVLCRIVEAEAGNEDEAGKLLIANVILNRVRNEAFPDTITQVVFQNRGGVYQFSPVANQSYYRVQVSEETQQVVDRALEGEDISKGALYFMARNASSKKNADWFDSHLTWLFKHGGHEFYM